MAGVDVRSLAEIRRRLGISQRELARRSGVSQSLISKIERGRVNPSYEAVKRIMRAVEEIRSELGGGVSAADICTREIISVESGDPLSKAIELMNRHGISQLPVFSRGKPVGSISESTIVRKLDEIRSMEVAVEAVMDEAFPIIPENTSIEVLRELFKEYPAVLLQKNGEITGIVTRADLFKALNPELGRSCG